MKKKVPKVPKEFHRGRFFATAREQKIITWLREYYWNTAVSDSIINAILKQLETLERQRDYMKQEKEDTSKEFEEVVISIGLLEVFYVHWRELMTELKGKNA